MIFNVLVSQDFDKPPSPPKKKPHELILYVTCLIYLRCMNYAVKATRRELKDRVIHSIFMIISFFTMSLQEKKCSEIWSTKSSQTFVASLSGLWFVQIVGVSSLWLNWNPQNRTRFWLQAALATSPVLGFCCVFVVPLLLASRSWRVAQRGFNAIWGLSSH